ncbi:MAG: serralysin, partial [Gaiellaceae bacterium]|nr:serralysin [Gaiellaceae bacterium]
TRVSGYECSIDGASFRGCSSPFNATGLSWAPHTFQVRAVDPAGNRSTPVSAGWTVKSGGSGGSGGGSGGGGSSSGGGGSSGGSSKPSANPPVTKPGSGAGAPDLTVRATATDAVVTVGQVFTETLSVTNDGNVAATNVTATILLPDNSDLMSFTPQSAAGQEAVRACTPNGRVLTCTLESLAPGQSTEIVVTLRARRTGKLVTGVTATADGIASTQRVEVQQRVMLCTITGTAQADVLRGTPGDDVICGLAGNDRLYGGGGNDTLIGGKDDDVAYGGSGADKLYGGLGRDRLLGQAGRDQVFGGAGKDWISGGAGADWLFGFGGSDVILGGGGNDLLLGDEGDDRLFGGAGNDMIYGGSGKDALFGGAGNDRLRTKDGWRDRLDGGAGRDSALPDRKLDSVRIRIELIVR